MSTWQRVVVCAAGLLLPGSAVADNGIHPWSGYASDVEIIGNDTVRIKAPGTFGFEALDPNGPGGLGYFQEISVDPNCPTGTVNVYILRDPNEGGGPGAVDVHYLHLIDPNDPNPNVVGNIAELNITGDLAPSGPTAAANAGALSVAGCVKSDIAITHDITGAMTLGGLAGDLSCDSLQDLTVGQSEALFTPEFPSASRTAPRWT